MTSAVSACSSNDNAILDYFNSSHVAGIQGPITYLLTEPENKKTIFILFMLYSFYRSDSFHGSVLTILHFN